MNGQRKMQNLLFVLGIAHCTFCISSCSIPSLESRECAEARNTVKEFYSWYLGTDAKTRERQRVTYDRFIAPSFGATTSDDLDPFFLSLTPPTTFKIGKCETKNESNTEIQVQLYWRLADKTQQEEVFAETIKTGDTWLIDKVESR